jgi:thymidine kinase
MQFFGESLLHFWKRISGEPSASMLASGLDLDFRREPFGHVLALAAAAMTQPEAVVIRKMLARCTHTTPDHIRCSHPAAYSQRLSSGGTDVILVGSEEYYRPACVHHHHVNPITLSEWPKMGHTSKRKA